MEKSNFEIQKTNIQSVALNRSNEIIQASTAKKFIEFSDDDKRNSLENIIKTVYLDTGYTIPGNSQSERLEHIQAIVLRLLVIIQERFPTIAGSEIRIACRNGATGEYGDVYGISPKTIIEWIQSYVNKRGEHTLTQPIKQLQEPSNEPTSDQWRNQMIEKLKNCYNQVQKGIQPIDWGNVLFKYLRDNKLIELSEPDIQSFIEQAKEELILENSPADAKSLSDRVDRRNLIKSIVTDQSPQKIIIIRARNLALREYLMVIDIDDEIEKIQSLPI